MEPKSTTLSCLLLSSLLLPVDSPRLSLGAAPVQSTVEVTCALPAPALSRPIDLALCLDTSGSMDDLIDAARQKLWAIVNELALAEPRPELRVALLTFGNDGHDPERGWVRVDSGLTDDLDRISEQLFALTTNGGTEYVARVVETATRELAWSADPDALRLLVVAGNEGAEQDPTLPATEAAARAIARGIQVSTLYCQQDGTEEAAGWAAVARRADGSYAAIDPAATRVVETPFDGGLAGLSGLLNETYVPLGGEGQRAWANQSAQDSNAASLNSAAAAARARTKAGALYRTGWDLVQRWREEGFAWSEVQREDLPEGLRDLTQQELEAELARLAAERERISGEIHELSLRRAEWVAAEEARLGEAAGLDASLLKALRDQARARGWRFPEPVAPPTTEPGEQSASAPPVEPAPASAAAPSPSVAPPVQRAGRTRGR